MRLVAIAVLAVTCAATIAFLQVSGLASDPRSLVIGFYGAGVFISGTIWGIAIAEGRS